jgi:hypothetical protein
MDGPVVTYVTETKKSKAGAAVKKFLPWAAIGLGALLGALVLYRYIAAPAAGGLSAVATNVYGTPTLSGIPAYDQYQATYPATAVGVNGSTAGSLLGANPLSPDCNARCNGLVGCTDESAANYNPNATCGCINCCVPRTIGCLDPTAASFNPFANTHDARFCTYATAAPVVAVAPAVLDCVAQLQLNPNAAGCVAPLGGCTDVNNSMYNPQATYDDGSCVYGGALSMPANAAPLQAGCQGALAGAGSSGCIAPMDTQFLGGFKGCGDAWDLRKGNTIGASPQ